MKRHAPRFIVFSQECAKMFPLPARLVVYDREHQALITSFLQHAPPSVHATEIDLDRHMRLCVDLKGRVLYDSPLLYKGLLACGIGALAAAITGEPAFGVVSAAFVGAVMPRDTTARAEYLLGRRTMLSFLERHELLRRMDADRPK